MYQFDTENEMYLRSHCCLVIIIGIFRNSTQCAVYSLCITHDVRITHSILRLIFIKDQYREYFNYSI